MARERIAVVADDLTGALDTGVMFAQVGLRAVVPLIAQDLKRAIGEKLGAICFSTDAGDETGRRAAKTVAPAAEILVNFVPDPWLKIEAGVPVACAEMTERRIEIVTRSGGFGASDTPVNLLNSTQSCDLNHRRKFG